MSRSCFRMSRSSSELVWDIFEFFDLFFSLSVILARNIDYKSTLQKTLEQFGLVASKYERKSRYKSNFQCVSIRRQVPLCRAICFSKVRFSLAFYRRNLVFFPWKLAWNSFYTVENPNLLVRWMKVSVLYNGPKFNIDFQANCTSVFVFFFFNPSAEIIETSSIRFFMEIRKPQNVTWPRPCGHFCSLQFTFEPQEGLPAVSDLRQGFLPLKIVQPRV